MSKPIIEVKKIYKKYKIGLRQPYLTLRDSLKDFFKKPIFLKQKKIDKDGLLDDEFWALKNISFSVFSGEAVGIVGRNGMGKSTLLKILSQITPPTYGEIRLRGRVASLLEIGTGFQQELTGRENIYLNGAILGMRQAEIKKKFDQIVDFADIEKFLDTPVKHYSSGMYMRLAFSIAAHLESEILLVDEVLAVGDGAFQKKCLGKMEDVREKGRTVLFVSHNMGAIRNLCPRTLLINKGEIIADSTTKRSLSLYNKLLRDIEVNAETAINDQVVRRGSGAIRFTNFELQDTHTKKRFSFEMGETIRFKMTYKVFENINGLAVFIALRSGITREIVTSVRHRVTAKRIVSGTEGSVTIEMPDIYIRPGEYPLYIHVSEVDGNPNNFDVLDDLIAPLVIVNSKIIKDSNFDPSRSAGYFSLPSKIITNKIYEN
ncbi:MAG: hypothetical protein ACD_32C00016G0001 [uncultured bacterium]|nr:MAG: hypothetical protein ACD_32C00016G0001 [uncultured bacterium]